ncbi:hypothetical protein ACFWH4_10670 [Streptomyces sp. NPDC127091]|uniref:hypothetical protein n=1 Tax=Streptomyces sp. NPDC127091 TaxID=3347134 RepID=UPI00364C541E
MPVPVSNGRRSAADSLAAVTAPGLPSPPPPPVPSTFRSDGLDNDGDEGEEIGMGTLGLAAVLAVALAALRGTAGALTDWRQRRMERAAEAAPLRAARLKLQEAQMRADAAGTSGGGRGSGRVPSSNDYGRRSLARTGSGGSGGGGGRTGPGAGRSTASTASTGSGTSRTGSPSGSGSTGPGRRGGGSGSSPSGPSTRSTGKSKGSSGSGSSGSGGGAGKGATPTGATGSSSGGNTGTKRPGVLGQLALDRSKRRTARQTAVQKEAARQQKADLAERKRATKDGGTKPAPSGAGGSSTGASDGTPTSAGTGRVTLGKAIKDEARRRAEERLRRRREDPARPFLHRTPRDGAETAEGAAATTTGGDTTGTAPEGPETAVGGPTPSGPAPGPGGTETDPDGGPDPDWEFYREPPGGGRRNPWDSLFEAEWDARVVWTVEQVDPPGTHARRWEPDAIGPAPAGPSPAAAAAGTTTTKETRVSAPLIPSPRAGGTASEHLTDVTLDDVLTVLAESKSNCFATYDECAVLADKARELRDALAVLAEGLAQRHNVVGRLTSAAMRRLSESMAVLARAAEAMRAESLRAAEAVEVAHDEMHDAYKPVQQATADAGLTMPSARIHNEEN